MKARKMEMYSEKILAYYENPPNKKKIEDAQYSASVDNPLCGDQVNVFLTVENGKVTQAAFDGQGCAISQAAASMMLEKLEGKTIEEARNTSEAEVLQNLGVTISPARTRCAFLGLGALKKALKS